MIWARVNMIYKCGCRSKYVEGQTCCIAVYGAVEENIRPRSYVSDGDVTEKHMLGICMRL